MAQISHSGGIAQSLAEATRQQLHDRPGQATWTDRQSESEGYSPQSFPRTVSLSIHENSTSSHVLLNADLLKSFPCKEGDVLQFRKLSTQTTDDDLYKGQQSTAPATAIHDGEPCLFHAKAAPDDIHNKMPTMQISAPQTLAEALNFPKNCNVSISWADPRRTKATHVELLFKDQYLARADMWRLIRNQVADKCVYRGQRIEFMNSIKVVVNNIFLDGERVSSGIFHASTKPIFRSESARYVLFIQMSKEMWEFDAEGSGEIMFDKVVNGFLPELFRRWRQMQVRHVVSIVLFTRMEYPAGLPTQPDDIELDQSAPSRGQHLRSKDYYRVVASDMGSIESASILDRLKREFQNFQKDVSIRKPAVGEYAPLGGGLSAASAELPEHIIMGEPSPASRGNILEAINLASSQFAFDYIDRDLMRTGVSIVVISPGTGVYDVDHSLLISTTENLTDNGVGIDLVCLSRMPLHSVPLFRYKAIVDENLDEGIGKPGTSKTPTQGFSNTMHIGTPSSVSQNSMTLAKKGLENKEAYCFGIPHWVDISFWSAVVDSTALGDKHVASPIKGKERERPLYKPFKPRIRMYELQMMGVMGDSSSQITIANLAQLPSNGLDGSRHHALPPSSSKHLTVRSHHPSVSPKTPIRTSPLSTSISALKSSQADAELREWMDSYDEGVFRPPRHLSRPHVKLKRRKQSTSLVASRKVSSGSHVQPQSIEIASRSAKQSKVAADTAPLSFQTKRGDTVAKVKKDIKPTNEMSSRKISFGPRGLGIPNSKAAAAVATTDSMNRLLDKQGQSGRSKLRIVKEDMADQVKSNSKDISRSRKTFEDATKEGASDQLIAESDVSSPIPINAGLLSKAPHTVPMRPRKVAQAGIQDRVATLQDVSHEESDELSEDEEELQFGPDLPTLSPSTTMAPWLTVLNPCNPTKHQASAARLGRWQHLFPRPLKTSQIKWKSLCCPAAVPLTTEDFPSQKRLDEEFREQSYSLALTENPKESLAARSLVDEIVAFRLSRGFQIVIGERASTALGSASYLLHDVFQTPMLTDAGSAIYLSRGSTIHRLLRTAIDRLEVTVYVRHSALRPLGLGDDAFLHYTPLIRSMLAEGYEHQAITTAPQRNTFDWQAIDAFIAGHERPKAEQYVETLRPWRARFVLIPVKPPADSRQPGRSKDLTEEESRLEGIKRLTHLWQKHRYILPEDRRFTRRTRLKDDANPLDVRYFTKNPSAVVSEELHNAVSEHTDLTTPVQLLPEAEVFQRSGYNVKSLAEKLQGEKGIRIMDRRWHFKMHHFCFIGSELNTWLLENFEDVRTREDAVALGNDLMNDGLFNHVEGRHDFLDGHYFYQIANNYRGTRPDSRSLFGWAKSSVPPTPVKDTGSVDYPVTTGLRAGRDTSTDNAIETLQRPHVALSKSMIFDLAHGRPKTSYREELVNLHYDRLHNPDTCYHFRIEWMNTTPKLIQDTIKHWAATVESNGLRLVEVPIGEASSITSTHPFRKVYPIRLAARPPQHQPSQSTESKQSLPRSHIAPRNFHQKAILKHLNYVLDFEAAMDFPQDVDVTYSWGKPDYRYPQYIHRSGLLLAQIDDDGNFLILANRLYNNRVSTARASTVEPESRLDRTPTSSRVPLRAGDGLTQRASPKASPFSSPGLRPSFNQAQNTNAAGGRSPKAQLLPSRRITPNHQGAQDKTPDPEALTRQFERFCSDAAGLERFYAEQQAKSSGSVPSTPMPSVKQTPIRIPDKSVDEDGIPELALPGSLTSRENRMASGNGWNPKALDSSTKLDSLQHSPSERRSMTSMKSPLSGPQ